MNLLSRLFALPPVEKRYVPFWFVHSFAGRYAVRESYDDAYIYYSEARTSFYVALFLAILNVASRTTGMTFDFYFFVIDLNGADYVKTFLLTYSKYTPTILLIVTLPYYIVLLRIYANPRTVAPFAARMSGIIPRAETMKQWQIWRTFITGILFVLIAMYGSFGIFMLFRKSLHLENSFPYFLICAGLLSFLLAVANLLILVMIVGLWRYSGKHTG